MIPALVAAVALAAPGHAPVAAPAPPQPPRKQASGQPDQGRQTRPAGAKNPSHPRRKAPSQPKAHPDNPINQVFAKWGEDHQRLEQLLAKLYPDLIQQMPTRGSDPT